MTLPDISPDDFTDVVEMTRKLENYITNVFKDNDTRLAASALISATINTLISQGKTFQESMCYLYLLNNVSTYFINNFQNIKEK